MAYNVGILGATGAVGQEIIRLLHEREFPIGSSGSLRRRSAGRSILRWQDMDDPEATPRVLKVWMFVSLVQEAISRGYLLMRPSTWLRGGRQQLCLPPRSKCAARHP